MSYQKTRTPEGVEFETHDDGGRRNHGGVWGAGVGGFVAGAVAGSFLQKNRDENHGGYHNGCGQPQPYYAQPYGYQPAPVYAAPAAPVYGGCSENTEVNRFELKQSEELAAEKAKVARLESEKYADQVGIQLFERIISYVDRANDKQGAAIDELAKASSDAKVDLRGLEDGLKFVKETNAREFKSIEKQVNDEFKRERELSNRLYVSQPEVRICGSSYSIVCEGASAS